MHWFKQNGRLVAAVVILVLVAFYSGYEYAISYMNRGVAPPIPSIEHVVYDQKCGPNSCD